MFFCLSGQPILVFDHFNLGRLRADFASKDQGKEGIRYMGLSFFSFGYK